MRYAFFLPFSLLFESIPAFGSSGTRLYQTATGLNIANAHLAIRNDGDASIFFSRTVTLEEIRARDSAFAAATGSDLAIRDFLSDEEIGDIVLRNFDARDLDFVDLENRGLGSIISGVAKGVEAIVGAIKGKIEKDKARRGKHTSEFISKSRSQFPKWNWVICHTKHTYKFDGERGKDWGHKHQEFPVSFGKTIGYEIYWFKSGTFYRKGDGGFLNWAFGGNIINRTNGGKDVKFGLPRGVSPIGKSGGSKKSASKKGPSKKAGPKKSGKPKCSSKGKGKR